MNNAIATKLTKLAESQKTATATIQQIAELMDNIDYDALRLARIILIILLIGVMCI